MDRLYQMEVFVAVAEHECFADAAQKLGISASAVSRTIAALEKEIGVELIRRNTRNVDVTPAGLQYLYDARKILQEIKRIEQSASGNTEIDNGVSLTIRSPTMFGTIHLAPMIAEFTCRFPAARIRVLFEDGPWSDVWSEADIQIFIGEPPSHVTNATLIGNVGRKLCAAPEYLMLHGIPETLDDLVSHQVIAVNDGTLAKWEYYLDDQKTPIRIRPQLIFETVGAAINAAVNSGGVTQLLSCQAAPLIETGKLTAVLEELVFPVSPIYMIENTATTRKPNAKEFAELVVSSMKKIQLFNPPIVTLVSETYAGLASGYTKATASAPLSEMAR